MGKVSPVSDATQGPAPWEMRNFARPEGLHYMRHAAALARWPILDEQWARQIEARRLGVEPPGAITSARSPRARSRTGDASVGQTERPPVDFAGRSPWE
jgi:hypothetical protein